MAAENTSQNDLPQVLLIKPPVASYLFGDNFYSSKKFQLLKAYESPLPLNDFLLTHAQSVRAILSSGAAVTSDIISLMPALKVVVTISQGLNHIDRQECRLRGIAVASVGTVFSADRADLAVGLLIDVLRKVSAANRFVKNGLWPIKGAHPLGFKEGIGSEVAKRIEAFGCSISYNSRTKKPSVPYPFYSDVHDLAADSDILIIVAPEVLLALGKEGVIINIARGAIIDEKELVQCLLQGEIGGAGLDVFEHEPDVPSELFALENVVMSPHGAAVTYESLEDHREIVVGNLEAFFSNEPLLTPVKYD